MQLICETLFPPRMSVTITFLTYSSYTSQSTAIFIPVYLFIARQSRYRARVRWRSTGSGEDWRDPVGISWRPTGSDEDFRDPVGISWRSARIAVIWPGSDEDQLDQKKIVAILPGSAEDRGYLWSRRDQMWIAGRRWAVSGVVVANTNAPKPKCNRLYLRRF